MQYRCWLRNFLASLIVFLIVEQTSSVAVVTTKQKVTYEIPREFTAGDDLISNFKAVSSHGRSDETSEANAVTYTTLQVVSRAFYLLVVFSPMFLTSGLAYLFSWYRNYIWFRLFRYGISQGGAAFIKWAQWASTRPDIFPEDLCTVLASLQSGAPEHSFAFTKKQIEIELGAPVYDIFEYFSSKPIASGSIAQVYKARLNGHDVAVKVRHPNVEEQIGIDFIIMKAVASAIESIPGLEWLKLSETMSQFSATIASQTDLSVEGKHLFLFNHHFKHWRSASFPKPIILTPSVLVESFEFGDSVDKYAKTLKCKGKLSEESHMSKTAISAEKLEFISESIRQCNLAHFIVTTGEDIYLKMLLQDNLMHADLHPGNILIQQTFESINTDPSLELDMAVAKITDRILQTTDAALTPLPSKEVDPISAKIVLVDAGMTARLVVQEQRNFIGLLEAMGEGRGDEAADHVMKFSDNAKYSKSTRTAFRKDMKLLFACDCRGYGNDVDIGLALRGILNLVRIHKITIDANYATLVMNCLCLDGMAQSLLPTYNILDGAKPLLRFNRLFRRVPGT